MGMERSNVECINWKIYVEAFVGFMLIWAAGISVALTNPGDGKLSFWLFSLFFSLFLC